MTKRNLFAKINSENYTKSRSSETAEDTIAQHKGPKPNISGDPTPQEAPGNSNEFRPSEETEQTEVQSPISSPFVKFEPQGRIVHPEPGKQRYPPSPEVKPNDTRDGNVLTFVSLLSLISLVGVAIYFHRTRHNDSKKTKKRKTEVLKLTVLFPFEKNTPILMCKLHPKIKLGQIGKVKKKLAANLASVEFQELEFENSPISKDLIALALSSKGEGLVFL